MNSSYIAEIHSTMRIFKTYSKRLIVFTFTIAGENNLNGKTGGNSIT
ncbi:MAG: hypothetical protein LBE18_02455 [Planctomycetaceae bacterium]|nr:hypothetical protein [Planctomycetaceae bacterium]